jgi:hypothetical protein
MKKPSHYFVFVGHGTISKNKLQIEFKDYLKSLSGILINADKIEKLKDDIVQKSIELNQKYKRCKPLKIGYYNLYGNVGFSIDGFYDLQFHIIEAYYTKYATLINKTQNNHE